MSVLIIGANPTGLILAYQLASYNIPFRIIDFRTGFSDKLEKNDEPILLSPISLNILQNLNLLNKPLFPHQLIKGVSYYWKNTLVQNNLIESHEIIPYSLLTSKHELEKYLSKYLTELNIKVEWETKPIAFVDDKLFTEKNIPKQELGERKASQETWIIACEANDNPYLLDLIKINNKSGKTFTWFSSSNFSSTALSSNHIHNLPNFSAFPKYIFPSFNYDSPNQFYLISQNQHISLKEEIYLNKNFCLTNPLINQDFFSYTLINFPLQYKNILFVGHKTFNCYHLFPLNINVHIQAVLNLSWKLILSLSKASTKSLVLTYDQEVNSALKLISQKIKSFSKQLIFTQKWFPYYFYWKLRSNSLNKNKQEHLFNKFTLQYSKTSLLKQNNYDKEWKGPQCGSIAPNYLIEKNRFLLDPIQGKKHLLLFFKENKTLASALYEEYGNWIEIISIQEKNIKDIYHASDNSLYIIRPDYIIGYRSKDFKIKDIVTYLIKIFKNHINSNNNSIKESKLSIAH